MVGYASVILGELHLTHGEALRQIPSGVGARCPGVGWREMGILGPDPIISGRFWELEGGSGRWWDSDFHGWSKNHKIAIGFRVVPLGHLLEQFIDDCQADSPRLEIFPGALFASGEPIGQGGSESREGANIKDQSWAQHGFDRVRAKSRRVETSKGRSEEGRHPVPAVTLGHGGLRRSVMIH